MATPEQDRRARNMFAEMTGAKPEEITGFILIIQYGKGIAMVHNLCCDDHARLNLARLATSPPDLTYTDREVGPN